MTRSGPSSRSATPGAALAPAGDAIALRVQALRFRWPGADRDILDIESLQVARGGTLFVRGPSGCGKSTLLSLLAGVLSIGQQQRVAAARALIGAPELVIADEPTSALDEALREAFMDLLLGACTEAGAALVFVSHDARLAARFMRQVDLPAINRAAT